MDSASESWCNDSDGRNFCQCQAFGDHSNQCDFYGRYVQPLAASLGEESVATQERSAFFDPFPREIRNLIYEYALTDTTSYPPDCDKWGRTSLYNAAKRSSDIGSSLLQSCKRVYLEAYKLPLLLNSLLVYDPDPMVPTRPFLSKLAPWQFALIQSITIGLDQGQLERRPLVPHIQREGSLTQFLLSWQNVHRCYGTYVAPRLYNKKYSCGHDNILPVYGFGFVLDKNAALPDRKDENEVTIAQDKKSFYGPIRKHMDFEGTTKIDVTARAMVARPLTRLTIVLGRIDWKNWAAPPDTNDNWRLSLDPSKGWGAEVCLLSSLKSLELVLETWTVKKEQLDAVVEQAKSWKFPLITTNAELVYQKTDTANWKTEERDGQGRTPDPPQDIFPDPIYDSDGEDHEYPDFRDNLQDAEEEDAWLETCRDIEVRVVQFVRRTA